MRRIDTPTRQYTVKQATILLDFIMQTFSGISRNKAKAILSGGGVLVDGRHESRHDLPLTPGMQVEISRRKPPQQLKNKFVKLVYEDSDIIVVDKAPGILSMGANHHAFSVKSVLDDYLRRAKQKNTAHVVHRLDRDTSGLLVYAKTIRAEQILEHNWHDIVTDRRYLALVSGTPEPQQGTVDSRLKDNKAYVTLSYPQDPGGGKYAVTHYRVLKTDGVHSLVELKLETGRKNQIRVHMQQIGHPVCGDIKYGNGDNPIGRLALHAFRLNFYHPMTSQPLRFETPQPKPFVEAINKQKDLKASDKATQTDNNL